MPRLLTKISCADPETNDQFKPIMKDIGKFVSSFHLLLQEIYEKNEEEMENIALEIYYDIQQDFKIKADHFSFYPMVMTSPQEDSYYKDKTSGISFNVAKDIEAFVSQNLTQKETADKAFDFSAFKMFVSKNSTVVFNENFYFLQLNTYEYEDLTNQITNFIPLAHKIEEDKIIHHSFPFQKKSHGLSLLYDVIDTYPEIFIKIAKSLQSYDRKICYVDPTHDIFKDIFSIHEIMDTAHHIIAEYQSVLTSEEINLLIPALEHFFIEDQDLNVRQDKKFNACVVTRINDIAIFHTALFFIDKNNEFKHAYALDKPENLIAVVELKSSL